MKGAAAGVTITIVMNTHIATAIVVIADTNTIMTMEIIAVADTNTIMTMEIIAVADMTTGISIITKTRAAVVKNTTMNTEKNVVVGMTIITGMTTMCRGIRRTASAKFATRTRNTAMCAAKV